MTLRDYRISELLNMSIVQKAADFSYKSSGLTMAIVDAVDTVPLVTAGRSAVCHNYHRANPISFKRCIASDNYIKDRFGEAE
jgi:hypothetical protein